MLRTTKVLPESGHRAFHLCYRADGTYFYWRTVVPLQGEMFPPSVMRTVLWNERNIGSELQMCVQLLVC